MGHTNATKHKIILKDLDSRPFRLDEVREHLELMLDAGVV